MSENFNRALEEGIGAEPIIYITTNNLEKNYFPPQAAKYYKMLKDMVGVNVPFQEGLKVVFEEGITQEQIRNYINNLVQSPDITPEVLNFFIRSIELTKGTEIRLEEQKARENSGPEIVLVNDYQGNRAA